MKVTVVYHADKGDSKVVEWGAFTFFDGVPVEVEDNDANAHMLGKISNNRLFEVVGIGKGKLSQTPVEPEVYPEETPDDDPESEPEEDDAQAGTEPEEKTSFEDYVPVEEEEAGNKSATKPKPRAKSRSKHKSKHRAA